jgi:hypothetical protein
MLDRRFLDLMDHIEQTQKDQIAEIGRRLEAAERRNHALEERIAVLERMSPSNGALVGLNASIKRLADLSESLLSSSTFPEESNI